MSVDVQLVSRATIAKLADDPRNVQLARERAGMELASPTIRVSAKLVGSGNCATKISPGLESRKVFFIVVLLLQPIGSMRQSPVRNYKRILFTNLATNSIILLLESILHARVFYFHKKNERYESISNWFNAT